MSLLSSRDYRWIIFKKFNRTGRLLNLKWRSPGQIFYQGMMEAITNKEMEIECLQTNNLKLSETASHGQGCPWVVLS